VSTTIPPLGLLLDVDGPIASPVTRTINIRSIIDDLVALAGSGVPIAFITGRSDGFIRSQVVGPLIEAGLSDGVRMFGVCEKGGVWFPIGSGGVGEIEVDETVAPPAAFTDEIRAIVADRFSDTMFFDETKVAMISIEQRTDVSAERYRAAQSSMNEAAFSALVRHGLGARFGDREVQDADGQVPFRVESTIISTDIESVKLDKDRGAARAIAFFAESGPLPKVWRSVGDSRSDYLMADQLYAQGFDVAHVDVRPAGGALERPYRVIIEGDAIYDQAGAIFLSHWVKTLGLRSQRSAR
jgi:hypothetical protein